MEEDPPAGVPEWIVTYGDMMSLLLTFFIMLVSLSEVKASEKYRAVLESLHQRLGYLTGPAAPPGENFPLNAVLEHIDKLGSTTNSDRGRGGVKSKGPPGADFRVHRRRDGVAINVGGYLAFPAAGAELSAAVESGLQAAAAVLNGKPNKIEIRGHTGSQPLPADATFGDEFELAYERARNVALFLERSGIQHNRLRVSAAGNNEPVAESAGKQGWDSDRVEILVLDTFSAEYSGERDIPD